MALFNPWTLKRDTCSITEQQDDDTVCDVEKPLLSALPIERSRIRPVAFHVGFAILYCVLIAAVLYAAGDGVFECGSRPNLIYTPARSAMNYERKSPISTYSDGYRHDPFFGDPSLELEQSWNDRLRHSMIRLSEEEFSHYNQSGILLGDGSGYLATPTVYHDLHCLRYLHRSLYASVYFPDDSVDAQEERNEHTRHCLHNLAHSVMCSADMTIRGMRWHPCSILPSPVDHEHECLSWEGIDGWARERSVDTGEEGLLIHPTLGEVFPKDKSAALADMVMGMYGGS